MIIQAPHLEIDTWDLEYRLWICIFNKYPRRFLGWGKFEKHCPKDRFGFLNVHIWSVMKTYWFSVSYLEDKMVQKLC